MNEDSPDVEICPDAKILSAGIQEMYERLKRHSEARAKLRTHQVADNKRKERERATPPFIQKLREVRRERRKAERAAYAAHRAQDALGRARDQISELEQLNAYITIENARLEAENATLRQRLEEERRRHL